MRLYKYDMVGASLSGHTGHPQAEILRFAPDAYRWRPESIADCWLFVAAPMATKPSFIIDMCPGRSDEFSMAYLDWLNGGAKPEGA